MSQSTENDIAIVGMALRVPGANSLEQYWSNLANGVESVTSLTDEQLKEAGVAESLLKNPNYVKANPLMDDVAGFDASFFDYSPLDAQIMDPQHRHFLEVSWEAFESAGIDPSRFSGSIGVFAGSGHNAYMPYNLLTNRDIMKRAGFFLVRHTGNDKDFLATRVSYEFDLKGPSINLQTACSTSLVAAHYGVQSLLSGECDLALAGGVTIEMPHGRGYLYKEGEILSPDGHCRPFDESSSGTLFGSGAGVVLLRRYDDAVAEGDTIYAIIKGSAVNNDGAGKVSYMAPSVEGQAAAIHEAITLADVDPESIDYIECHGTGTPIGDPIEVAALTQAYRACGAEKNRYCAIGSVKSNIGHLDTAAGVAGLIKTVLAMRAKKIPAVANFKAPNPNIDFDNSPFYVNDQLRDWTSEIGPRRAAISSLGVGGTNAHLIVEEAVESNASLFSQKQATVSANRDVESGQLEESRPESELLVFSAKTQTAVTKIKKRLETFLEDHNDVALSDIAFTLKSGRHAFPHRAISVIAPGEKRSENVESENLTFTAQADDKNRSVSFMFGGGGGQYPNMGLDLYQQEPIYRDVVDQCLEILNGYLDFDLRNVMFPGNDPTQIEKAAELLKRPSLSVTSLFITQYAQAQLWQSWGIQPAGMIGHSLGENTAACVAGVLSLKDALGLVALRGQLFEKVEKGGMLSVNLSEGQLKERLPASIDIACLNADQLSTVSGSEEDLDQLQRELERDEIAYSRVRIDIAAHSAMLEPILAQFDDYLNSIQLSAPQIPFVSNVTGDWITNDMAIDPKYWVKHLRQTVRFSQGVGNLILKGPQVLLEVGPGKGLCGLVEMHSQLSSDQVVINSMRKFDEQLDDRDAMLVALGRCWMANSLSQESPWSGYYESRASKLGIDSQSLPNRVPLPTYPFEHQNYWVEPGEELTLDVAEAGEDMGLPRRLAEDSWLYHPVWRPARRQTLATQVSNTERYFYFVQENAQFGNDLIDYFSNKGKLLDGLENAERLSADKSGQSTVYVMQSFKLDGLTELAELNDLQSLFFDSIFRMVKALNALDLSFPTEWVLLVENGFLLSDEAQLLNPWVAALDGAMKVAAAELPNLKARVIQISRSMAPAKVYDEICYGEGSPVVLTRRQRWEREFAPVSEGVDDGSQLDPAKVLQHYLFQVNQRGHSPVVLITGGLGGLGKLFAEHLAQRWHEAVPVQTDKRSLRLALVSRRAGSDSLLETEQAWIQTLKNLGVEVACYSTDITDPKAIEETISQINDHWGGVEGVIHTAGVLDDQLVELKELSDAHNILAPKVKGLVNLERALSQQPLKLLVNFSSISALAGIPGQFDYAAANGFLDGFSSSKNLIADENDSGALTVSINWPAWRDLGMAQRLVASSGYEGEALKNHPWLDCLISLTSDRAEIGMKFTLEDWLVGEHRLGNGVALIPGTGYLELIRAAVSAIAERQGLEASNQLALEMSDILFLAPFVVKEDEARWLMISLDGIDQQDAQFVIQSRLPNGESVEHVTGAVSWGPIAGMKQSTLQSSEISNRCQKREQLFTDPDHHPFLQFGQRWSALQSISVGEGEALCSLSLKPLGLEEEVETFRLHPALLDMAIAGSQTMLPHFSPQQMLYIPIGINKVRFGGVLSSDLKSWVRLSGETLEAAQTGAEAPAAAAYDATVMDDSGQVQLEVEGFTLHRIDDPEQLMATVASDDVQTLQTNAENDPVRRALALGIDPAEGLRQFERILCSALTDGLSQFVVAPVGYQALVGTLNGSLADAAKAKMAMKGREVDESILALENVLRAHPAVEEVVVKAYQDDAGEERYTAHYMVDMGEMITISDLRAFAEANLPADQVPQHYFEEDFFEKMADGTIDRSLIDDPYAPADAHLEPRNELERKIAKIWSDLLGLDRVGVTDNFYDIGGHSLLAIRVITRVEKLYGVRLNQAIVALQTLEQVAKLVAEQSPEAANLVDDGGSGGTDTVNVSTTQEAKSVETLADHGVTGEARSDEASKGESTSAMDRSKRLFKSFFKKD